MWTLILTMTMFAGFADGGVSVHTHSVDGFTSEKSCNVAGKLWLDSTPASKIRKAALCVNKN